MIFSVLWNNLHLPELQGYPTVYWFNRLFSGVPGKGGGTKVLQQVLRWADSVNAPIVNFPSAYGKLSQQDLEDFYKRHGFVEPPGAPGLLLYLPRESTSALRLLKKRGYE